MKRIAIFAENLYGGGVQRILQIVLRNFDYDRYDVTLYTNHHEQLLPEFYPTQIKQKHIFSSPDRSLVSNLFCKIKNKIRLWVYYHCTPQTFYRLFIRNKYDVGIAFIEGYATRFLSGAPAGMKKIAWLHTDIETNHWTDVAYRNRKEEIRCYGRLDMVVCVSDVVQKKAKGILGIKNTVIVHNPIDVKYILQQARMKCELEETNHLRFISLGALIKVKGYDRLLAATKRLLTEGFDFELLILGEGAEREYLEDYIVRNKMSERVSLLGYKDNPYPYLTASDVYVCSSYAEGFNTAVSEALILGKAIISTNVSGIVEQLGDRDEYGIVVDNSVDGLYNGLKSMMNHNNIKYFQRMTVEKSRVFNIEKQMNQIYDIIEK